MTRDSNVLRNVYTVLRNYEYNKPQPMTREVQSGRSTNSEPLVFSSSSN